ncbi:MAG: adenine deaminase [Eubacteriaceae bacterium]|jgi:adenine deaminase|nr:adenine deaminase [Eubacteriaceae bacterium]
MTEKESCMARGLEPADLVLKNGTVINVFTDEMIKADVAVSGGKIIGVGQYSGLEEIDCTGRYLAPGFVDAHVHIESSMLVPGEFSKVLARAGTLSIVADPHEAVNVSGGAALDWLLSASRGLLADMYFMVPSAVPASDLETNGAGEFLAEDMKKYASAEGVIGLGETMRFFEVIAAEQRMMDKIEVFSGRRIDGHAPGITGGDVQAYRLAGVDSDHECSNASEALEKLRAGFSVLAREGSGAKNVEDIISGLLEAGVSLDRVMFCTDDKHTAEIKKEGHISTCVRKAIALGVPAAKAYRMGSLNAAEHYGLKGKGALGAGYDADILIIDDPAEVTPSAVIKGGRLLTEADYAADLGGVIPDGLLETVMFGDVTAADLAVKAGGENDVICMNPHSLITTHLQEKVGSVDGSFVPDEVYNKLCVIERHGKTGEISAAPIKGFGIRNGAVATTVAHDSHNIIAAGDNDIDIIAAAAELKNMQGGYVIASGGKIVGRLALPVCGLMTDQPCSEVEDTVRAMLDTAHSMGVSRDIDPFITLSFMALTVIPELRLTERGLFDVNEMSYLNV